MHTSQRAFPRALRTLILTLGVLLLMSTMACSKKPEKILYGTWSVERDAWTEQVSTDDLDETEAEFLRLVIESVQYAFQFDKDGTYRTYVSTLGEEERMRGSYTVLSSEKDRLMIELTDEDNASSVSVVTIHGEDRIDIALEGNAAPSGNTPNRLPLVRTDEADFDRLYSGEAAPPTSAKKSGDPRKSAPNIPASADMMTGAWLIDNAATIEQMPDAQRGTAGEFIKMVQIGMIFNQDQTLEMHVSMMGEREFQEGSYTILEAEADRLAIALTRDTPVDAQGNPIDEEPSRMIVAFLDNNHMLLKPVADEGESQDTVDEQSMILKRTTKTKMYRVLNEAGEQPTLEELRRQ